MRMVVPQVMAGVGARAPGSARPVLFLCCQCRSRDRYTSAAYEDITALMGTDGGYRSGISAAARRHLLSGTENRTTNVMVLRAGRWSWQQTAVAGSQSHRDEPVVWPSEGRRVDLKALLARAKHTTPATVDQDHVYDGDTGAGACTLGPLVDPRQGGLLVDSS